MKIKGYGYGSMMYGVGYGFARPDFGAADIEISVDGSITIWHGGSELGQGIQTILCQFASQELNIPYENIRIISADTDSTPNTGPVSASRSTFVQGLAVIDACKKITHQIKTLASELLKTPEKNLKISNGRIIDYAGSEEEMEISDIAKEMHNRGMKTRFHGWYSNQTEDVNPDTSQGDAFRQFSWASQMAEVEVDTETGTVKVIKIVSATDAGKAINPQLVEGQIEGGAVQGLGYAIMEEMKVQNGVFQNASFSTYLIPTSLDVPQIVPLIVEVPDPVGPYGAKGIGEPALIPTAPAILNAINNAIGVRIRDLPASPERILMDSGSIPPVIENEISIEMIDYPPC